MHLFSLWLLLIIFSSSYNGNMGCAKQQVPGIRERRWFLRTENVLKNASSCWQESRLYIMNWGFSFHGSLQSIVLTSTSSEDVKRLWSLWSSCGNWCLLPQSQLFSPSFSSYLPCYALKWVIWGHNVIGFSSEFYFSMLKLCTFREILTYSVNYQCFYFLLEMKFKLGFIDPGFLLSYSSF